MGWLSKNKSDDSDNLWRKRYYQELDHLESEMAKTQAASDALRRLASRLCVAAKGHASELDDYLNNAQRALRKPLDAAVCDQWREQLTPLIERLDRNAVGDAQPGSDDNAAQSTHRIRTACKILVQIIDALDFQGPTREQAGKLRARLYKINQAPLFEASIDELAAIIKQQTQYLSERAQHFQALLNRVTKRLDEVTEHLSFDEKSRDQDAQNSQALKDHIQVEMLALDQLSREATDLNRLQADVESKISRVDQHLLKFREREREIASAYRQRADQLRIRIAELEDYALSLQSKMQKQRARALKDNLTGIPNREAYQQAAQQYFEQFRSGQKPLCLAVWDIDHFKTINDSHGHQVGDEAIQLVAQHLAQGLGSVCFTARVGGEEFASFLPGLNRAQAVARLDQVRHSLSQQRFRPKGQAVTLTVSCGVSEILPTDSLDTAYARADTALYEAKRGGRNQVRAFSA